MLASLLGVLEIFSEFLQDKSQTYLLCLFFSLRKAEQVKQSVRFFALFHERT